MPLRRSLVSLFGLLLAVSSGGARGEVVVRVEPGGAVGSLQQARDRVRDLRKTAGARAPATVRFAAGTYRTTGPVEFGPEDGATTYEVEPGAQVIIDGGREIQGFKAVAGGLWAVQIPEAAANAGRKPFEQLYVDGRRAVRARSPNAGYFYMRRGDSQSPKAAFTGNREDLKPLAGLSGAGLQDASVIAYHSWEVSRHRVAAYEAETGRVALTGPAPWEFLKWGANQRYHLENFREALDQPGEWFLDRDGTLYYQPRPGETIETTRFVAPVAEAFVTVKGAPEGGALVEDLTFRGLTFRHSAYSLPPGGHADNQAANGIPAVVMVDGAKRVTLKDCRIEHIGVYAVWFRRGCSDSKVEHCALIDLGAGGVRIGENGLPAKPEFSTGKITVDDCIIRGYGRWFPGAIGVWIGQSSDNAVTHNDIADGTYTAVSVGWSWGYKPTDCKRNHIDDNRLHHIGRNILSDMGGVYTLGLSEGTTINRNVIHDVDSYNKTGAGGWGLYNDEGSTGIVLENNVVWNTTTGSYHQHYGRENVVRNNIFAFSRYGQVMRSRPEEHLSFTLEKNLIVWTGGPLLTGRWDDPKGFKLDSNLYYETSGATVEFPGDRSLEAWRRTTGGDGLSKVEDPGFVNAEAHDFRLKPGSPALALGFRPFDDSKAGVRGGGAWRAEADAPLPDSIPAPSPPPLSVSEDFESVAPGGEGYTPDLATLSHGGRPGLVTVTEETAAGGRRSLKIADAAGLKNGFDPHFHYRPHFTGGTAVASFAVRLEPGAVFYHEWRDGSRPYKVGPSVWFADGKVKVGGKAVMDAPPGEWIRVEIQAPLIDAPQPTWNLSLTRPGAPPVRLTNLPAAPGWKALDWVGFVSPAEHPTAVYLDDLELHNRP